MKHAKRRNSQRRSIEKLARRYRVPKSSSDDYIETFLSALDCPRSLAVWLLYKSREHQQLVDLTVKPSDYSDASAFRDALTATEFLSKSTFLRLEVNREEVALTKFFEAEELCRLTNLRLKSTNPWHQTKCKGEWLLNATIRKISQILSDDYSAEEIFECGRWGPGSTFHLRGRELSASNKFRSKNGITRDLVPLVCPSFYGAYPGWSTFITGLYGPAPFEETVGNRLLTVPKNAKTDRVIAVEPGINLWFQLSAGHAIRRRLRRYGLLHSNAQERNQYLAKTGSITGHLATVDFSMASDTISSRLVEMLLPPRWHRILDAFRSKFTLRKEGKEFRPLELNKFSSMGNGFTFELETLIFYSAACAVCDYLNLPLGEISVYGDDVILPVEAFNLFVEFSADLGFKVNTKKSYNTTYYRESCGSHWFNGIDCKPVFHKEKCHDVQSLYKLANSIRNFSHRTCNYLACDSRFRDCWLRIVRDIPKTLRFGVSRQHGDVGLISNFDEALPLRARDQIEGYYTFALIAAPVTKYSDDYALLLERLTGRSDAEQNNSSSLRGVTRTSVKKILASEWYDLGMWL